jgi:hypothetical protein
VSGPELAWKPGEPRDGRIRAKALRQAVRITAHERVTGRTTAPYDAELAANWSALLMALEPILEWADE